jgi:hypothetical protein
VFHLPGKPSLGDDPRIGLPFLPSGPNHDLHVTAQGIEEPEEPVHREAIDLAPSESRDFRLVNAQNGRGLSLGELSLGDDVADAMDELGFARSSSSRARAIWDAPRAATKEIRADRNPQHGRFKLRSPRGSGAFPRLSRKTDYAERAKQG